MKFISLSICHCLFLVSVSTYLSSFPSTRLPIYFPIFLANRAFCFRTYAVPATKSSQCAAPSVHLGLSKVQRLPRFLHLATRRASHDIYTSPATQTQVAKSGTKPSVPMGPAPSAPSRLRPGVRLTFKHPKKLDEPCPPTTPFHNVWALLEICFMANQSILQPPQKGIQRKKQTLVPSMGMITWLLASVTLAL